MKKTKTATAEIASFTMTASGWYEQNGNANPNLPSALRVEETQRPDINAKYIIRGRSNGRRFPFFSGILLMAPGVWHGNIKSFCDGKTTRSLLVLTVSGDGAALTAHLFPGCMPKQRAAFVRDYLNLKNR